MGDLLANRNFFIVFDCRRLSKKTVVDIFFDQSQELLKGLN